MNPLPVDFQTLAQGPHGQTGSDYPYAIKATDLMKNFVYAALNADESLIEETTGQGGHVQRRLKIDAGANRNEIYFWDGEKITVFESPPLEGTYVLGAQDGVIKWLETEDC